MTTQQYHLYYNENELKRESILLLRALIKQHQFFKESNENKLILLKMFNKQLSEVYNIPLAEIKLNPILYYFGVGNYNPFNKIITLNNFSLVTFLHEFKHHLNHELKQDNTEDSARGFSHSLYYLATPKLFKSAIERGLLIHQKSMN